MELQLISEKIIELRGQRVMLDAHLAELYEVETKQLKQAVRRNSERFPSDFIFEISNEERNLLIDSTRSQFVTSYSKSITYTSIAFTEQGVAMLATVLRSPKAVQVNNQVQQTPTQ